MWHQLSKKTTIIIVLVKKVLKKVFVIYYTNCCGREKETPNIFEGLDIFLLSTPHPVLCDEVLISAENQDLIEK